MSNGFQKIIRWLSITTLASMIITALAPVLYWQQEGLIASIAFTLLVISVLANIAMLLGYVEKPNFKKILKGSWIIIALICLVFSLYVGGLDHPASQKDAQTFLIITMFILTFPTGVIVIGAVGAVMLSAPILEVYSPRTFDLFVLWLLFIIGGYGQWFKVVPWLIEKFKSKRAN